MVTLDNVMEHVLLSDGRRAGGAAPGLVTVPQVTGAITTAQRS